MASMDMNDPDYFFNVSSPVFASQIMGMAEGSTAEVMGSNDSATLQKFTPTSYALAKKTGMIELEITCVSGTSVADEVKEAMLQTADENGITDLMVHSRGMKIVHLYFYPKENGD